MSLSQYSSLIRLAAAFGWSDIQIKKELADIGVDVTPQAIGKFRRATGIVKRSKAEAISFWFCDEIITARQSGRRLKELADEWGVSHQVMSKVFDLLELPGDERCSVELLINVYPDDLSYLKAEEYSLRQIQGWLQAKKELSCALETIRKAMEQIVLKTMDDWPETKALANLLKRRPEQEKKLIVVVIKRFLESLKI
ncbi:hypothetical protein D0962_34485 [Leptolyngbyaceae cyanobacterium CCMR0082]|uniref:Uncharacterized protein n=1 Tax=Adonisia turfae CCMR0082 TaxID=2304604 RepID=A0A6M0SHJ5_9CYAN|nr:hypothetical protein [Adonisia turfae CCMR0082]